MRATRHRQRRASAAMAAVLLLVGGLTGCDGAPEPGPIVRQPDSSPSISSPPDSDGVPTTSEKTAAAQLATGLDVPWAMALLPDGSLLVTERDTAEIKKITEGEVQVIGVVEDAREAGGEGGLLGIAVPPDFESDPRIYLYYTTPNDNRVVSMGYGADGVDDPEEVLIGIPRANIHNGGRIRFGPDGYLYIGTGDAADAHSAQDPASLGGKILRLTPEGAPAPGNPSGSAVYSMGHRNVQGLAWDSDGRLWASEFGPDRDDELNLIVPGGNYGWPAVTGAPGRTEFIDAQVVWPSTATSSPSGMAIVGDVAYIGGLRGERMWQVPLHAGSAGNPVSAFNGKYGRLRDVIEGDSGNLLIATNETGGSRILVVTMP